GADATGGATVGIINIGGGAVSTSQIQAGSDVAQVNSSSVTRLVNFNGGTLKVKNNTHASAFMQGLTGAYVYSGGGTIDTNSVDTTIGQALLAPTGSGLQSVTINTPGSGYRVAPIVVVSDATGKGASAVARRV